MFGYNCKYLIKNAEIFDQLLFLEIIQKVDCPSFECYRHKIDEKKEGPYEKWYTKKCTYKNGKRHGKFISWYSFGRKKIECSYKNGILDGRFRQWWHSGEIFRDCIYKNGDVEGKSRMYSYNGKLGEECNYKNGEKDGFWHRGFWFTKNRLIPSHIERK